MTAPATLARLTRPGDVIVGMADLRLSTTPGERLVTYALGSCLGVTVWDPAVRVGGMLHVMLPSSGIDPEKAERNPAMFVDTGVPKLFRESYAHGARKERMLVHVVGGAYGAASEDDDQFRIGKRNFIALRNLLWKNNVLMRAHDVGGCRLSRTMRLDIATGEVTVRTNGKDHTL